MSVSYYLKFYLPKTGLMDYFSHNRNVSELHTVKKSFIKLRVKIISDNCVIGS